MVRVALLSRWHPHATGYGKHFASMPNVEIVRVWDEIPERGEEWAKEMGVPFEADLDAVINAPDVDAIVCVAPTSMHKEIFLKAAAAGKHIFTEKVMTAKKSDALEIKKAIDESGVKFCISFPMLTNPAVRFAKKLIEDGTLGRLSYLRIRNAHSGISSGWLPEHFKDPVTCGGGAMMDLGAHPMYISSFLMGKPYKVNASFNKVYDTPVDDNCVSVIEFENKVLCVSETGFVTSESPFQLELSGSAGTFMMNQNGNFLAAGSGWTTPEIPGELGLPSAEQQFIDAIEKGTPIAFGTTEAVALTELMDLSYISYHEDRPAYASEL